MRFFIITLFCLFISFPAIAQDTAQADSNLTQRLELSQKMHEIWPVRIAVENALEQITARMPQDEGIKIRAAMRKIIKYDQLEDESIEAMAEIFTAAELEAMIAFYGSAEGRSISAKTDDYYSALSPIMGRMLDKAMLDIRTGGGTAQ